MQIQQRINAFVQLGSFMGQWADGLADPELLPEAWSENMQATAALAKAHNGWFTVDNLQFALKQWSKALTEENLQSWVDRYTLSDSTPKTVAIVMAGNVPLVGFHDFLSVLITGHKVLVKLSSNDKVLLPFLTQYLISQEPAFESVIEFTEERLENFDAVIATGSNNTARYFEYYFGKYPNIIRKNRNSVAVLSGDETPEQLQGLADDIFRYFGLGCRNVSKIFLPEGYEFDPFFNAMFGWKDVINDTKYMNNYDYNKAVYLMSDIALLDNEFMLLKEDTGYASPISVVFYECYNDATDLEARLRREADQIQCVVGAENQADTIAFGQTQQPSLWDYPDGIDTVNFLLKLSE